MLAKKLHQRDVLHHKTTVEISRYGVLLFILWLWQDQKHLIDFTSLWT